MIERQCAICDVRTGSTTVFPARLQEEEIDEKAFSARRFYDKKIHFQWVRCNACGLLRSDPIADPVVIAHLYANSDFNYDPEVENLRRTYGAYLAQVSAYIAQKERLLEIGCGNGFFLEEALQQGFKDVIGIEPSRKAIEKATPKIRTKIREDFFNKRDFSANFFDVICVFQTLDHLFDPSATLKDCYEILKPGGVILAINHNVGSWSVKLLGEKSPIFDIEHTYLYDFVTMRRLFEKNNYNVRGIYSTKNLYSIDYLFSLLPIQPRGLKKMIHRILRTTRISKISLWVPLGNLSIIAQKI